MSDEKSNPNRRQILQLGLTGGALMAVTPHVLAANSLTPAETEGPFYPITPQADTDFDLTQVLGQDGMAKGQVVTISGQVRDQHGQPVVGATVDIWQANSAGRYRHPHDSNPAPLDPNFQGWAVVQSGATGGFKFKTIVPGPYPVSTDWTRPPHIHFKVTKRGHEELITQMYFPDQALNQVDRLLQSKSSEEQALMVAQADAENPQHLHYDVVLKAV